MQRLGKPRRQSAISSPELADELEDEGSGGSGLSTATDAYGQTGPKTPEQANEVTLYRIEPAQGHSRFSNESCGLLFARTLLLTLGLLSVGSAAAILTLLVIAQRLNLYFFLECSVLVLQSIIGMYVALTRNKCLVLIFALICMLNAFAIIGLLMFSPSSSANSSPTIPAHKAQLTTVVPESASLLLDRVNKSTDVGDNDELVPTFNIPPHHIPNVSDTIGHVDREQEEAKRLDSTTIINNIQPSSPHPLGVQATKPSAITEIESAGTINTPNDLHNDNETDASRGESRLVQAASGPPELLDILKPGAASRKLLHEDPDKRIIIVAYILWVAVVCDLLASILSVYLFNTFASDAPTEPEGFSQAYQRPGKTRNRKPLKSPILLLLHKTDSASNNRDSFVEVMKPTVRTRRLDEALPYGARPLASGNVVKNNRSRLRKSKSPGSPGSPGSPMKVRTFKRKSYYGAMSPKKQMKRKYLEPKRIINPMPANYSYQPVQKIADDSPTLVAGSKHVRGTPPTPPPPPKSPVHSPKSISSDNLHGAVTRTGSLREDPPGF